MLSSYPSIIIFSVQWRMHLVCVDKDLKIKGEFLLHSSYFNRTFGAFRDGVFWFGLFYSQLSYYININNLLTFSNCCSFEQFSG